MQQSHMLNWREVETSDKQSDIDVDCCGCCCKCCNPVTELINELWIENRCFVRCRKIIGVLLCLLCLVGIVFYWAQNISKMTKMWNHTYTVATGYSGTVNFTLFQLNISNSTFYVDPRLHLFDSKLVILDPSKLDLTPSERKQFYKHKKILFNTNTYNFNNLSEIQILKPTFITTDKNENIHSVDGASVNVIKYNLTKFEETLLQILMNLLKVLITIGFILKFIILLGVWLISWYFTLDNFIFSHEIDQHHIYQPNCGNSMCGEFVKSILKSVIGMILPLTCAMFMLPFLAMDFGTCLVILQSLPHWMTFELIMICFGTTWIVIFIMLLCLKCCFKISRSEFDNEKSACECCWCLIKFVIGCIFSAFLLASLVFGMICIWNGNEKSLFAYCIYMISVASMQLWLFVFVSHVPKCRFDNMCNLKGFHLIN